MFNWSSNSTLKYMKVKVRIFCYGKSDSLQPHGLQPTRLFCPWNFPGKNTRMGYHFLLQGIFPTQGLNPHLLPLAGGFFRYIPMINENMSTQKLVQVFTAALLTWARKRKHHKSPSVAEWIDMLWQIHTTKHYSTKRESKYWHMW